MTATGDLEAETFRVPPVRCLRCAVAAAHPFGYHADWCPNCARLREQ